MKIKPINGWTKQTMIDHIKTNFKGKSVENGPVGGEITVCMYRGHDGKKCAAGFFIQDKDYDICFENSTIDKLMEDHSYISNTMPLDRDFMKEFQTIHDSSHENDTLTDMLNWIEENVQ